MLDLVLTGHHTSTLNMDDLMIIGPHRLVVGALLLTLAEVGVVGTDLNGAAYAHEGHQSFAAGEPGDPKKPARTIKVVMRDDRKKMAFEPARITVRKGEQSSSFWKTTALTTTNSFLRLRPRTAS